MPFAQWFFLMVLYLRPLSGPALRDMIICHQLFCNSLPYYCDWLPLPSLGSLYLKVCLLMLAGMDSVPHSVGFYYSAEVEQAIW